MELAAVKNQLPGVLCFRAQVCPRTRAIAEDLHQLLLLRNAY